MIAELHSLHRTELLKYCCMICGNVSDAEDLLQTSCEAPRRSFPEVKVICRIV